MSKLTFPAVAAPYRGFVDKLRNWMRETATFVQDSPASRAEVVSQIGAFVNDETTTIVSSAQVLTGVAPSGTYTTSVTFTVANGAITAIVLA